MTLATHVASRSFSGTAKPHPLNLAGYIRITKTTTGAISNHGHHLTHLTISKDRKIGNTAIKVLGQNHRTASIKIDASRAK